MIFLFGCYFYVTIMRLQTINGIILEKNNLKYSTDFNK